MAGSGSLVEGVRLWVREIILVLFLAGALEMLLPETDVKRFARVAVGFFVVLAVGRPLLSAVGGGFIFDRGLAGLGSWELGVAPSGLTAGGGSGSDAVERGTQMWQASRDRALAAARAGLEAQVAALAEKDPAVAEAVAVVDLEGDPSSSSYGSLQALTLKVWLAHGKVDSGAGATGENAGGPGDGSSGPGTVGPVIVGVQPIVVGPGSGAPGAAAAGDAGGGPLVVDAGDSEGTGQGSVAEELAKRLRSELVLLFGVPAGGMRVEVWP